ncbi:ABC transporter permease [Erysipelothrix aquatica]|uniref:ABC transporter permease n=1 Tax=Erysipelothrix aquatica TaxID=2683714 RepID=UPI00135AF0F3|nr:ABC transporter permease [Erysipelothrix aquatica]
MNSGIIQLDILQFSTVYVLLILVLAIMKYAKIDQSKLLFVASLRMSIQLYLAGLVLTYVFGNPHPLFVIAYLVAMVIFASHRILKQNQRLNKAFRRRIVMAIAGCGTLILVFFVTLVVRTDFFNPQYTISLGGMIFGNSMTAVNLGLKAFTQNLDQERAKSETLLNAGIEPKAILMPHVKNGLEMAFIPTLNSMLNMGIIALPGMMTGQILSGTVPLTAIMYQIAIMISIATSVTLTAFVALYWGYPTLISQRKQITWYQHEQ